MTAGLVDQLRCLREALATFDASLLTGQRCVEVAAELAATELACAAAKAMAASRAASCGEGRDSAHADLADWLASLSGSSLSEARRTLRVADALTECPETRKALAQGELSIVQAEEIARSEQAHPGSEAELVDMARRSGLAAVRERARCIVQEAADPAELHRRRHRSRHLRHWTTDMGMVAISAELPPEIGLPVVRRIDVAADRLRRAARRAGETAEAWQAYAADALADLCMSSQSGGRPRNSELVVLVDLAAFRRGAATGREICRLQGAGPIPVSLARELSRDAFIKAVLHDGVAVHTVTHMGRHIPAELRTALELGPPPDFSGVVCVEEGCDRRYHLEWDHIDPIANNGPTRHDNLAPRCWPHHRQKTERDRAAGLLGPEPGRRARDQAAQADAPKEVPP